MGNRVSTPIQAFQVLVAYNRKYKLIVWFIVLNIVYQIWKRRARAHPDIPMSIHSHTPIIGNLWHFVKAISNDRPFHRFYIDVVKPTLKANNNHNLFAIAFPSIPGFDRPRYEVVILNPKLVEIILTDIHSFQKTEVIHEPMEELFGDGIFAADGEQTISDCGNE